MIIKADRQLIAAVLIDAVILHHGTRFVTIFFIVLYLFTMFRHLVFQYLFCRPSKEALEQLAKDLVNYTRRLGIGENYKRI